jgi:hypothetical protein
MALDILLNYETIYYLNFARQTGGRWKSSTDIPVCGGLATGKNACATMPAGQPPDGLTRAIYILRNITLINSDLGHRSCPADAKFRYYI